MSKRSVRSFAVFLVLALFLGNIHPAGAADYIAAEHTYSNGQPYYIMVDRSACTVTIYGLDANGYYTVPVKAMVCSVGRSGHETPTGTYSVTSFKRPWLLMKDGSYGQYATQFYGNYLFHSVCYSQADPSTLITDEYNMLGGPASLGCIRLQTIDAKWIYDNCGKETQVTIYDGTAPGPLGKPDTAVSEIAPIMDNGWDPTDPRPENPWRSEPVTGISLDRPELSLTAGESDTLTQTVSPSSAAASARVVWSSSDPSVASVDSAGKVTALSKGTAVITAACRDASASCTVEVSGRLLPFTDMVPGAWYYPGIRYTYESGLLVGTGDRTFSPGMPTTWGMAVQIIYRTSSAEQSEDTVQAGDAWYSAAFRWADGTGLLDQTLESSCDPDKQITRQELAALFYRYETVVRGRPADGFASLSQFSDEDKIHPSARDAVSWAVGNGLLQGTSADTLRPAGHVDRAQIAAILQRYSSMQA